jgi:mRNA interferase MazF
MHRGEIWWANLPSPAGRRPVLLLSRESAYKVRTSVTVAVVTRKARGIPVEVVLDEADGMPAKCVVNLDDILTIPKAILSERITVLSDTRMALVSKAIAFALDL